MMKKSKAEMKAILHEAKREALQSIGNDDGGSANMDDLEIFDEDPTVVLEVCKEEGLTCIHHQDRKDNYVMVHSPDSRWQGYNNTRQVEAMQKTLEKKGIKSYVHYVID